jgi:hypothetical protein
MFTNGMNTFNASANPANPLPANSQFPVDTQLTQGVAPETVAVPVGLFGVGGTNFPLTDAATIAVPLANANSVFNYSVTLGGNRTLANPTGTPVNGQRLQIYITQDGTGNRTLAYGTQWKFPGGAPTLSTAAGAVDRITAYYNSTLGFWMGALEKAFA